MWLSTRVSNLLRWFDNFPIAGCNQENEFLGKSARCVSRVGTTNRINSPRSSGMERETKFNFNDLWVHVNEAVAKSSDAWHVDLVLHDGEGEREKLFALSHRVIDLLLETARERERGKSDSLARDVRKRFVPSNGDLSATEEGEERHPIQ